ncbi:MAG: methylisocitrate lyase [Planctomycetes bacterium]|nr:methylisocitrate lyase [Planctomycetota bacterium]
MTTPDVSPGKQLREAATGGTLLIPGAFNALTARLIEQAGFRAAYLSGAAFSAGALALPDIGLFTLSELCEETRRLTRSTSLPLVVDADTGFGEAVNVERTVVELENAGAAAIQLEDQQLPKRCGHLSGKTLVGTEEMCGKLRAAVAARRDKSLVILARTDARAAEGLEAAIARAQAYISAGADWIFPEALETPEEFARFAKEVRAPLVANMTEFGRSPLLTRDELTELGYAAALLPVTTLRVAMGAVERALQKIAAEGTQKAIVGEMQTRQELYDLLGYAGYEERDRSYFQGDARS